MKTFAGLLTQPLCRAIALSLIHFLWESNVTSGSKIEPIAASNL